MEINIHLKLIRINCGNKTLCLLSFQYNYEVCHVICPSQKECAANIATLIKQREFVEDLNGLDGEQNIVQTCRTFTLVAHMIPFLLNALGNYMTIFLKYGLLSFCHLLLEVL